MGLVGVYFFGQGMFTIMLSSGNVADWIAELHGVKFYFDVIFLVLGGWYFLDALPLCHEIFETCYGMDCRLTKWSIKRFCGVIDRGIDRCFCGFPV